MTPVDISVLVPTKNEASNIERCLASVRRAKEIVVIDSASSDETATLAERCGARVIRYEQRGPWPKKRQWALEHVDFASPWVLILDADESVTSDLMDEIEQAVKDDAVNAYSIRLNLVFLGKPLRFGGNSLWKTNLIRRGFAGYERRLDGTDESGCDMEVHENVVVRGRTRRLRGSILHHDHRGMFQYLDRHNRYSTWEALVFMQNNEGIAPLWRSRSVVDLRRWLKRRIVGSWWLWLWVFIYRYFARGGFLDGGPGAAYCWLQAVQLLHTRTKIEAGRRGIALT